MESTINIAKDYTPYVGGRYEADGEGNGTTFRKDFLVPVLREVLQSSGRPAVIILDGAAGYPSSFLEEAFGGLVRKEGFSAEEVLRSFEFVASESGFSRYIDLIKVFVKSAKPEN
jgi:hypothetical protein